jgi:hypothetical protein
VLAATLSRLRRLCVSEVTSEDQVRHLGRLLGACPHLTQLQLVARELDTVDAGPLLMQGLAEAAAVGQTAADPSRPPPAADRNVVVERLPPLQHLDVYGMSCGLPDPWLGVPTAAARLTFLELRGEALLGSDLGALSACVRLKELVLRDYPGAGQGPVELPEELSSLRSTLTRLVRRECQLVEVPAVVWCLTALRHLHLAGNDGCVEIPEDISCLQQLQFLDMSDPGVRQLPVKLGDWLPQLEVLQVDYSPIKAIPTGLTRLTRLTISSTQITSLDGLPSDLRALKQLVAHESLLQPPLQGLRRFSALELLHLGWQEDPCAWDSPTAGDLPGPLPRLRSLNLCAVPPGLLAGLEGSMGVQGVTHLTLEALEPPHMAAVETLGVLPHLQQLVLMGSDAVSWAALGAWLHQQPSLTRLRLGNGRVDGMELQQLPEQLEDLELVCCRLPEGQLPPCTHLTRLRRLRIDRLHLLLPWLAALTTLEELVLLGSGEDEPGWEVVAQLPLLRRVNAEFNWDEGTRTCAACLYAPHLCWAQPMEL